MTRLSALAALVGVTALTAAGAAVPAPAGATAGPIVYAHRGGALEAPENTLGAFRQSHGAYGAGGAWLELDVQLTSDGELVVIHDATLDRTTDCGGPVIQRSLAQVQACDAATEWNDTHEPDWPVAEPVPSLREVLVEGKGAGWRLMPELKNIPGEPNFELTGEKAAAELLALVAETGFPTDRLLVQSFFPTSLDRVEEANPAIDTALLTTSQLHPALPNGAGFYLSENAPYATARGYEVSAPNHGTPDMSAAAVGAAHALGREVVVWTVNDGPRAGTLAGFGVDGIITDAPGVVTAALSAGV